MHDDKKKTVAGAPWRLLAVGVAIGTVLMATPAAGHIGSVSHLWNHHIKPKADQRYVRFQGTLPHGKTVTGTCGCCHDCHRRHTGGRGKRLVRDASCIGADTEGCS